MQNHEREKLSAWLFGQQEKQRLEAYYSDLYSEAMECYFLIDLGRDLTDAEEERIFRLCVREKESLEKPADVPLYIYFNDACSEAHAKIRRHEGSPIGVKFGEWGFDKSYHQAIFNSISLFIGDICSHGYRSVTITKRTENEMVTVYKIPETRGTLYLDELREISKTSEEYRAAFQGDWGSKLEQEYMNIEVKQSPAKIQLEDAVDLIRAESLFDTDCIPKIAYRWIDAGCPFDSKPRIERVVESFPRDTNSYILGLIHNLIDLHELSLQDSSGDQEAPTAKETESNLAETEAKTPALDIESVDWIAARKENENKFGLKIRTLSKYRTERQGGMVSSDKMFGIDRDDRIWRRKGTEKSQVYYLVSSLPEA